jgi:hypothetical protein
MNLGRELNMVCVVGQAPRPYDLMWPIARRREGAMLVGRVGEGKSEGLGRERVSGPGQSLCVKLEFLY